MSLLLEKSKDRQQVFAYTLSGTELACYDKTRLKGGFYLSTLKSTQQKCLSIETKVCQWFSLSTLIKVKTPAV